MADGIRVLGIWGSLRKGSFNEALIRTAAEIAPDGMTVEPFDIAAIPFYNQDVERDGYPEPVRELHEAIAAADAVLIATPEYQHSVPGVLKNALDWASRPPGKSPLNEKPGAAMGASPGMVGTARAQMHLREILAYNKMPIVKRPEVLVANAGDKIEDGILTDEQGRDFLRQLLENLAQAVRDQRAAQRVG